MIQTELKPVTVYRSTDTGAPQLTGTAGSLKTVLKACLVEGYGSQPALGWEMKYEDNTTGVFKSKDPKSPNAALQVKNSEKFVADLAMMIEPSGLDAARKIATQQSRRFQYQRSGLASNKWILVGHSRAFVLVLAGYYKSRMLWFGDFPSLAVGDTGNCALLYSSDGTANMIGSGQSYQAPYIIGSSSGGNGRVTLAKSYNGLSLGSNDSALSSLCSAWTRAVFPDVITNGLAISECYINESIESRFPLRGLLPGLYCCANNLNTLEEWSSMDNFVGSSDQFFNLGLTDASNPEYSYFLINTTAWRA